MEKASNKTIMLQVIFIIIGIISILYGVRVLGTNSGTAFFVVWFLIGAFFIGLSLITRFHVWERIPKVGKIIFVVIICAAAVIFIAVEILIAGSFSEKGEKDLDYVIVLGAQVRKDGPSVVLQYRLDAAYDYLVENEETICIVSGGQGPNEPFAEAVGMKQYLQKRGIDPQRILTEEKSMNTKQNIDNSMKMLDPAVDHVGIITNNFHVFRGVALANKAGIKNVCGISAGSLPSFLPNNMLREFFGVLKDFAAGNI